MENLLIILSGPSGCGKDSIIKELIKKYNNLSYSISYTTRKKRKDEVHAKDYYFITEEDFNKKIKEGFFIEYTKRIDSYYGTSKEEFMNNINSGKDTLMILELQGAAYIKKKYPDAMLIFVLPPDIKELNKRLLLRNSESKFSLESRFKEMYKEFNGLNNYDYVIINDKLENAINKVESIIIAEKCRVNRISNKYLNDIKKELDNYTD